MHYSYNNLFIAVRAPCKDDAECGEGAHCTQGNNTASGKKCACIDGYYEENLRCNGNNRFFLHSKNLNFIKSFN